MKYLKPRCVNPSQPPQSPPCQHCREPMRALARRTQLPRAWRRLPVAVLRTFLLRPGQGEAAFMEKRRKPATGYTGNRGNA